MIEDDSKWVNGYFAASSIDLTPVTLRQATHVKYVPVSHDPEVTRRCATVLSDTELQRADRFATRGDKTLYIQRRAFRRFCGALTLGSKRPLSQIEFNETEYGRPYLANLPDYWFSFSSCRFGFVGAWSSTHGVGVDLEDQTRDLEASELARQYFSEDEARAVEVSDGLAMRTFFQFWSLKEAALKSIGRGLPFGLDAFEFKLEPNPHIVGVSPGHGTTGQFMAHFIGGPESCTAVVIRSMT